MRKNGFESTQNFLTCSKTEFFSNLFLVTAVILLFLWRQDLLLVDIFHLFWYNQEKVERVRFMSLIQKLLPGLPYEYIKFLLQCFCIFIPLTVAQIVSLIVSVKKIKMRYAAITWTVGFLIGGIALVLITRNLVASL